jgi:D-3-phosphoglycerate dehydrogenase / 2-oxoglutarate reductase
LTGVFQAEVDGELAPYSYEEGRLSELGIELSSGICRNSAELVERARDADILWLEVATMLTNEVLEQLPGCQLVVRWGIGVDPIDLDTATRLGVAIANAPTSSVKDVAEHAIGLLLAVTRRIPSCDASIHAGGWPAALAPERRLAGSVLGIVGLGRIGQEVARLGKALGCTVIGHDVRDMSTSVPDVSNVELDYLLAESDLVSLHASLGPGSRHLIDERRLGLMKDDAVLINTCRGQVIDEAALIRALDDGKFFGIGLDVFETEPLPAESPLRLIDRAVLTPHAAGSSPEGLADLRREMCDATIEWVTTGWCRSIVNSSVKGSTRNLT